MDKIEKKHITVSVCMITYNHENFIAEAIEGVLMQQTDFPIELVIGVDCSTDNTRKICEEYARKNPEIIKLLVSDKNLGMMSNFVRTLKACCGKYIAFCEGDDFWCNSSKLKLQHEFLSKNEEYTACYHDVEEIDEGGNFICKRSDNHNEYNKLNFNTDIPIDYLISQPDSLIHTSSAFLDRAFIRDLPKSFENYVSGDIPIFFLQYKHGKSFYYASCMSKRRIHVGGITQNRERLVSLNYNYYLLYKSLQKYIPKAKVKAYSNLIEKYKITYLKNNIYLEKTNKYNPFSYFKWLKYLFLKKELDLRTKDVIAIMLSSIN